MSWDRRHFLIGGGVAAAGGLIHTQAHAAPGTGARSVTEFGVEPDTGRDQSEALQRAVSEISASGRSVYVPGGTYRVLKSLELPPKCALIGDPGQTVLSGKIGGTPLIAAQNQYLYLDGITLDGLAKKGDTSDLVTYLVIVAGGELRLNHCEMKRSAGGAVSAQGVSGTIHACNFTDLNSGTVWVTKARGLLTDQCRFERCWQCRMGDCASDDHPGVSCFHAEGDGLIVSNTVVSQCSSGISLRGSGTVSGNYVSQINHFGLRLGGSGDEKGAIFATGNTLVDCATGIGLSAGDETILASLNLIVRPKDAAIRAFSGNKLLGPDLARESAEAYLNLTVAGNVVR